MPMGLEIALKLEELGLGKHSVEPRDIFLDELPDDPDVCVAIFAGPGRPPEFGFGEAGVKFDNPSVAIWFRGAPNDSAGPSARASEAYFELAKIQAEDVSGTNYLEVTPLQPPFHLKKDDNKRRVIFAFNYLARKEPS